MPKSYIVDDDYNDSRLDKWFKNKIINLPHSLIEKILRQNKIKVNKKKTKSSYRLQTGDLIEIYDISKLKPINRKDFKRLTLSLNLINESRKIFLLLNSKTKSSIFKKFNKADKNIPVNKLKRKKLYCFLIN